MARPDDSSLPSDQRRAVCKQAVRLLDLAEAHGEFPTPVAKLVEAANLQIKNEVSLDEGFVTTLLKGAEGKIKRIVGAIRKLVGLFDARDGSIYLDQTTPKIKKPFVTLHETGHGFLPWQQSAFWVCEDNKKSLDPSIKDQFEREANVFASEVLFQCDRYLEEAEGIQFGIKAPMNLAKKFGASVYSSMRRYVTLNPRACTVLVYDSEPILGGDGRYYLDLRRHEASPRMITEFGQLGWLQRIYLDGPSGKLIPQGRRRMVEPTLVPLTDLNGEVQECLAESFKTPYQTFVLICSKRTLASSQLSLSH